MRKTIKGYVAGFLTCLILSSTFVWANTQSQLLEAFYGVNIVVNGIAWNPPSDMVPFISSGRTFLPVRGIAEILDVPVEWDGLTRTVYIGTAPHGSPFWETIPPYERSWSMGVGPVRMLGNPYANAIRLDGGEQQPRPSGGWSSHNLNGQYNTITGTLGRIDGARYLGSSLLSTSTISFIGDGRELASFLVDVDFVPKEISVDVRGVLVLRIEITQPYGNYACGVALANAMIQ